jgi:hypothetical protein
MLPLFSARNYLCCMIIIDDKLVSDEVVEKQFVCNLQACQGGCCEEGDAGAPLETEELKILPALYETVKPYLTEEGIATLEEKGFYQYNKEFGWVTPAINGGLCAYGFRDENNIIRCGIEQAYNDGKLNTEPAGWKKPLSCHLYPIKTKKTSTHELVNYEPREKLCSPACTLGEKLKIPVYRFLKDALIRKYGKEFYEALDKIAGGYYNQKISV